MISALIAVLFVLIVVAAMLFAVLAMINEPDTQEPYLKFRKGTTIVCPNPDCELEIGTANRDVWSSDTMTAAAWDSEYITPHSSFHCPKCRALYARIARGTSGEIHTKDGWIRRSPEPSHA